jgi:hypothetical protein
VRPCASPGIGATYRLEGTALAGSLLEDNTSPARTAPAGFGGVGQTEAEEQSKNDCDGFHGLTS